MARLHRQFQTSGNGYDRYYDPVAGAAVVYEDPDKRHCFGSINGVPFIVRWPDTSELYEGDSGRPVAYRIRPEYQDGAVIGWVLYFYVYSGGKNRSEWVEVIQ
jgi:hypothetical protein